MKKIKLLRLFIAFTAACLIDSCGTVSTFTANTDVAKQAPSYRYIDGYGNLYDITASQLEFTPVSSDNTVDGVEDRGTHILKTISANTYNELSSAFDKQFDRKQKEQDSLAVAQRFARLIKSTDRKSLEIQLDAQAVIYLNEIVEPVLVTQE